ncbi:GNAT family N-acetyltransferase [Streptomyces sp. Je 1-369]|uniref:GNAT family N-acetyltransferase n=1 Tax=Streptomyces sp. Je 1-369 TaxID=2966192 RepID=UPI002286A9D2|nr:GNAT family N-acetyltransferase [Streptomyces sp. Je 1-369]WAL93813.1 GNAT family N-acetyltransferase [Streptomyces sp. Je 1-369]
MTCADEPVRTVLRPAGAELRPVVERLAQLYRHDMSEFIGYLPEPDGAYEFSKLPVFFDEPGRSALLIQYGSVPAGFVLTRPMAEGATSISAFFVVRALRRRGVGRQAALQLLRSRPGSWAIAFQPANAGAARFWRGVATDAVGSDWREESRPVPASVDADAPDDRWILLNTGSL